MFNLFNWFAEICSKILKNPCKNCIVQPMCFNSLLGDYKYVKKYEECKQFQKYRTKHNKIGNFFENIREFILNWSGFLLLIYVVLTIIMGVWKQWQLIFG